MGTVKRVHVCKYVRSLTRAGVFVFVCGFSDDGGAMVVGLVMGVMAE